MTIQQIASWSAVFLARNDRKRLEQRCEHKRIRGVNAQSLDLGLQCNLAVAVLLVELYAMKLLANAVGLGEQYRDR